MGIVDVADAADLTGRSVLLSALTCPFALLLAILPVTSFALSPEINMLPRFENSILLGEVRSSKLMEGISVIIPTKGTSGILSASSSEVVV